MPHVLLSLRWRFNDIILFWLGDFTALHEVFLFFCAVCGRGKVLLASHGCLMFDVELVVVYKLWHL